MNKNKTLLYFLSGFIPLTIFFVCAWINNFYPLGDYNLNVLDSFTQYSGMLLEYKNLLLHGNIFYSWNAGLGFNFFGTLTYYALSPLNLTAMLANPVNYYAYAGIMIYVRTFLLGLSMSFYLQHRKTKPLYTVLFSTIYALMGYTATYYYNFLWIDSIIALPFVIHGLDKLIDDNSPLFYIIALTITIILNYYIGYMICIFSLIYYIYRSISKGWNKKNVRTFIISSLLSGFMTAVIILPTFFALKAGKASLYGITKYSSISRNALTFFYTLTSGSFISGDEGYGPAQVYTTILVLVLSIFYFFNKDISKREKIATFIVFAFFYLSFAVNALNFAWQFFQRPVWWNSRFSFTFSFFFILTALKSLEKIDKVKMRMLWRVLTILAFAIACVIGFYFKSQVSIKPETYIYIFGIFSLILFIEMIFLGDKKAFFPIILIFTFIDLSINTYNSLKQNNRNKGSIYYISLRENLPNAIKELDAKNDNNFYRMELIDDYTSDDGLYFSYHGLNYFNSARNQKVINMIEDLGVHVDQGTHIRIKEFDPLFLSIFNVKYIYGKVPYFEKLDDDIYENKDVLSLGFTSNEKVKELTLTPAGTDHLERNEYDRKINLNNLASSLVGHDVSIYKRIYDKDFTLNKIYMEDNIYKKYEEYTNGSFVYKFTSDDHYLIMSNDIFVCTVTINGNKSIGNGAYDEIFAGDEVEIKYDLYDSVRPARVYVDLFKMDEYKKWLKELSPDQMTAKTYTNGHILEGSIDVTKDNSFLFTSIEYEEGMKIYVDGKETTPDILLNSLIGLSLEKGTHTIAIDYIPKGLIPGAIMSLISLTSTLFYLQIRKKNL